MTFADQFPQTGCVFVTDDDDAVRDFICLLLDANGIPCRGFSFGEALLSAIRR
jgi:FixJ family two-component response regulator